jgi:hypothetical protein
MALLQPFHIAAFRYPSLYAPSTHFLLPLCPHDQPLCAPSACGPPPARAPVLTHYGLPLRLAYPPLAPAAVLAVHARLEVALAEGAGARTSPALPEHRLAPLREYEARARVWRARPLSEDDDEDEDEDDAGSAAHDADWSRLVGCADPWADAPVLKGKVWTLGQLSGCFAGSLFVRAAAHSARPTATDRALAQTPSVHPYAHMLLRPHELAPDAVPWQPTPLFARLREHHCRAPHAPLDVPLGPDGSGDDVLAARPRGRRESPHLIWGSRGAWC